MAAPKAVRQMPKGGRKGGSIFPRIELSGAVVYARKLVSKTHTGHQPRDVIYTGVVGAKSGVGNTRISALKQYGFLLGDEKSGYFADELAKKIVAAPDDELVSLYQQSILRPKIFGKLFDTFHGDTVTKAKLKQRAADLQVHPDETGSCVDLYISGMLLAELVTVVGEQVTHLAKSDLDRALSAQSSDYAGGAVGDERHEDEDEISNPIIDESVEIDAVRDQSNEKAIVESRSSEKDDQESAKPRAIFNINISLDSSLDTEKLQKQLELLKRFGAI